MFRLLMIKWYGESASIQNFPCIGLFKPIKRLETVSFS